MKTIIAILATMLVVTSVYASCPTWKPYNCVMMPNGKMLCGCGI